MTKEVRKVSISSEPAKEQYTFHASDDGIVPGVVIEAENMEEALKLYEVHKGKFIIS